MGIAGSPDTFQVKMSEIMAAVKIVITYLDDLLCITTGSLDDHLDTFRRNFIRLQDIGLKVNALLCHKNKYLGYILS